MDFLWLSSKYALFAVANPDINVRVVQCKQNFVSSCEVENIVDLFPKKKVQRMILLGRICHCMFARPSAIFIHVIGRFSNFSFFFLSAYDLSEYDYMTKES